MAEEFIVGFVNDVVAAAADAASVPRRQGIWRYDTDELSESAYIKNFRLSRALIQDVVEMVEPIINKRTQYDVHTKVLCALHFLGHGSYQTPVGQHLCLNMSQPSVSRCITEVVEALNHPTVFGQWVRFPNTFDELDKVVSQFYRMYNFPGVVGCIDCTHIAIVPPNSASFDERSYVNRKNYHSINTQLICDATLKILNINAIFPGSTHDSHIWNNSNVLTLMEALHSRGRSNYHLIGDSGYALRSWLLTPLPDADHDTPAFHYNSALKKVRCTIERCNGVLKSRFRCLIKDRTLHYAPNKATKIINACAVLHNMCIESNLEDPDVNEINGQLGTIDPLPHIVDEQQSRRANPLLAQGRRKQQNIISNYFQ